MTLSRENSISKLRISESANVKIGMWKYVKKNPQEMVELARRAKPYRRPGI
jgi:hypothetical protein